MIHPKMKGALAGFKTSLQDDKKNRHLVIRSLPCCIDKSKVDISDNLLSSSLLIQILLDN